MMKNNKTFQTVALLFCISHACIAFAAVAWGVLAIRMWPVATIGQAVAARVNEASKPMLECTYWDAKAKIQRSNPNCLPSSFAATTGAIRSSAGEIDKALKLLTPKIAISADNSALASAQTVVVLKSANGAILDARSVVQRLGSAVDELHLAVADISQDVQALLKSSDGAVKASVKPLEELAALTNKLGNAVDKDGPVVHDILHQMLAKVQDENITRTIANIEKATKHIANTSETVDQVTQPLRKKVSIVHSILLRISHLLNAIKPW
jgi:hypothetical protein